MSEKLLQDKINDTQHLHFELFRRVRYNLLDGERVVSDLLDWRGLWYSVLPARYPYSFITRDKKEEYHPVTELSMLRCTYGDYWPADTLYIWTDDELLPELQKRVEERWQPSEVVVISPDVDEEMRMANLHDEHDRVLFVWWD